MYRFPGEETIKRRWIAATRRPGWAPSPSSYLCSRHFLASAYRPSTTGRKRLLPDSVPIDPSVPEDTKAPDLPSMVIKRRVRSLTNDHTYSRRTTSDVVVIKEEITRLKRIIRHQKKRLQEMEEKMKEMTNNHLTEVQSNTLRANFDGIVLELLCNEELNKERGPKGRRYSQPVKEFALTLHYYSPMAYDFMRQQLCLPHPATLRDWCSSVDASPGFFTDVITGIGEASAADPSLRDCNLVIDAMAIRKQKIWNEQRHEFLGFVDYGSAIPEAKDAMAKEALVFMLVGLKQSWKHPVGYFLVDHPPAEVQAQLIKDCIALASAAGVVVKSITFDGAYANQSTAKKLGANLSIDDMRPWFPHPTDNDKRIYVVMDACHMLKLMRNALGSYKILNSELGAIKWQHLVDLNRIQDEMGLKLGNKLSSKHIAYERNPMNVKLAAQTLSTSVADALDVLREECPHLTEFEDSQATAQFVKKIDQLFDLLNSRSPIGKSWKRPLSLETECVWGEAFTSLIQYLKTLTDTDGKPLHEGRRKTGVIGFVATLTSIREMAMELMTRAQSPYRYVLTFRWSQDYLEVFFSKIRRKGGHNNNPNVEQFRWAMRGIICHNAISGSRRGNCLPIPTDTVSLFTPRLYRRRAPEDVDEDDDVRTSNMDQGDEDDDADEDVNHVISSSLEIDVESPQYGNAVYYIAGAIVRKVKKKVPCSQCVDVLSRSDDDYDVEEEENYCADFEHLTNEKDRGGLLRPSKGVLEIIFATDKAYRNRLLADQRNSNIDVKIRRDIMEQFSNKRARHRLFPRWDSIHRDEHDISIEDDHLTQVIKALVSTYVRTRLYHKGKADTLKGKGKENRHRCTKLILFSNQ